MSKRKKKKPKGGNGPQWFVGKMPPTWIMRSCLDGLGRTFRNVGPRKSDELLFALGIGDQWIAGWTTGDRLAACPLFTPREASSMGYMANDIMAADLPEESAVPTIFFTTGPLGKLSGSCWLNPAAIPGGV